MNIKITLKELTRFDVIIILNYSQVICKLYLSYNITMQVNGFLVLHVWVIGQNN